MIRLNVGYKSVENAENTIIAAFMGSRKARKEWNAVHGNFT